MLAAAMCARTLASSAAVSAGVGHSSKPSAHWGASARET